MKMDKETIQKARQANLAEYLFNIGYPLIRNGNRYRHEEHESLVFTDNAYYWNSRQESGNAIDYLVRHMDMDFIGAVTALVGFSPVSTASAKKSSKDFFLNNADLYREPKKARAYLQKSRYIASGVIDYLVSKKLMYQEVRTNNAVFLMYDEKNNCVGAEVHGTLNDIPFKGVKEGSKYGYGFNVRISNDNTYDYALFFESAIDLLSFMDLKINGEGKSLDRCILISMAGLKPNVIKHSLKAFKGRLNVVLCVDNDFAGLAFIEKIKELKIAFITQEPDKKYKDWNEQLTAWRGSNVISRVLEREQNNLLPTLQR